MRKQLRNVKLGDEIKVNGRIYQVRGIMGSTVRQVSYGSFIDERYTITIERKAQTGIMGSIAEARGLPYRDVKLSKIKAHDLEGFPTC